MLLIGFSLQPSNQKWNIVGQLGQTGRPEGWNLSIIEDIRLCSIGTGKNIHKGSFLISKHLQLILTIFFLVGQILLQLLFFLQVSLNLIYVDIQSLILLSKCQQHLLLCGLWLMLHFLALFNFGDIALSSILPELVDDTWDNADQLCLDSVIHVKDEGDVLAPVASFDGYSQKHLPYIHRVSVYVEAINVLLDICPNLLLEVFANLLENLGEWFWSFSFLPLLEIIGVDSPENILH